MTKTQRQERNPRFSERDNPEAKIWDDFPPEWVAQDLRQFVRRTGKPDEWRWHCHSAPPLGSLAAEIVAENIGIPESLRNSVGRAPCPLCSLHGPKFYYGMLVYYRQEKCLRVIGRECGQKLHGKEFSDNLKEFRLKQEDDTVFRLLRDNQKAPNDLSQSITLLRPRARYIDEIRRKVLSAISKKVAKQIHGHIGLDGRLKFDVSSSVEFTYQIRDAAFKQHGHAPLLSGAEMLIYKGLTAEALLTNADRILASIDSMEEVLTAPGILGRQTRTKAWTALCEVWDLTEKAHKLCHQTQNLLEISNLRNLVSWANDKRSPIHIECRFDNAGRVCFAHHPHRYLLTPNSPELTAPLPTVRPRTF